MLAGLAAVLPAVIAIINKIIPDPEKARETQAEIEKLLIEASTMQQQINMKEAEHASMFVAGWRPFVGWVCGVGCAYSFLFQPLASWASTSFGGVAFPAVDTATMMGLLTGLLGLGGMRTFEKVKEVARDNGITISNPFKKKSPVTQYRD